VTEVILSVTFYRSLQSLTSRGEKKAYELPNDIFSWFTSNSSAMGSVGTFGISSNRTYGSQGGVNNFHSVFGAGGSGDTSTPPLLDLSEFPSLNRGQGDSMPQPNLPMAGKQPYGKYSFGTHLGRSPVVDNLLGQPVMLLGTALYKSREVATFQHTRGITER